MPNKVQHFSPLRYPGSKALLVDYIHAVILENNITGCTIIEPYAGSAIISIFALFSGIAEKAVLVERDPLIYSFWFCVFEKTDELIARIEQLPVNLETWHQLQIYRKIDDITTYPIIDMGLAGLFYNRCNYSGILNAGPLGGQQQNSTYSIGCRFNKTAIIEQIRKISVLRNKITMCFEDALHYLGENLGEFSLQETFLYVDPPYYKKGKKLYRYWHNRYQHERLANMLLQSQVPWLVSYDDHEDIRKLYQTSAILRRTYVDYVARYRKKEPELLISNLRLPLPSGRISAPALPY